MFLRQNVPWDRQPPAGVVINRGSQIAEGLVHAYAQDILGERFFDSAGYAHGVSGAGNGINGAQWVSDTIGRVAHFDDAGTGSATTPIIYIGNATGSGSPGGQAFSVVGWVKQTASAIGDIYASATSGTIHVRITSGGAINLVNRSVADLLTSSGAASGYNQWHAFGIACTGSAAIFAIDGKPAGSGTYSATFTMSAQYALGGGGNRLANGDRLGPVYIYNKALALPELVFMTTLKHWQIFRP